jgi:hypothetical protein
LQAPQAALLQLEKAAVSASGAAAAGLYPRIAGYLFVNPSSSSATWLLGCCLQALQAAPPQLEMAAILQEQQQRPVALPAHSEQHYNVNTSSPSATWFILLLLQARQAAPQQLAMAASRASAAAAAGLCTRASTRPS